MASVAKRTVVDRPYWHVALACPKCSAKGMIPWNRLDRVLVCRRCSAWYRTERGAALVEIAPPEESLRVTVRGSFGEWSTHRVRTCDWTNSWLARGGRVLAAVIGRILGLEWPGRLALAGALSAAMIGSVLAFSHTAEIPAAVAPALPTSLAERAHLFAEAWLDRDVAQMLRLTDRSLDRQLRQWVSKTPPPSAALGAGRSERTIAAHVDKQEAHRATLTVTIALAASSSRRVTQQQWVENDGGWYFLPAVSQAERATSVPRRPR